MDIAHSVKNREQRITYIVGFLLFALPFGLVDVVNVTLVLLLLHSLIFLRKEEWGAAFKNPVFIAIGGFFILHVLSLFQSEDLAEGGRQLEIKAPLFLATLLIIANVGAAQIQKNLLRVYFIGVCVVSAIALLFALSKSISAGSLWLVNENGTRLSFFTYEQLSNPFMHPGYFSTFVGFGIFLGFQYWLNGNKNKKLNAGLLVYLLMMLVLLQGRMNILAFIIVVGLAVFIEFIRRKKYIVLLLPVLAIGALFYLVSFGSKTSQNRFLQIPNFDYDITGTEFNSATYRLAEWTCAMDVIKSNFWTGTGVGDNRQELWDAYAKRGFKIGVEKKFLVHNQYLETMLANGLIGLLWLLGMLVYLFRRSRKVDNSILYSLSFLALCLITESMFERAWALSLFSIFFPFAIVASKKEMVKT
jgi:O-antigen ligase